MKGEAKLNSEMWIREYIVMNFMYMDYKLNETV